MWLRDNISVLHISTQKKLRGGERQIKFLHEGLLNRKFSSLILSPHNSALSKNINDNGFTYNSLLDLYKKIVKINPTIIHCHDSRAFSVITIFNLSLNKKIIVTKKTAFNIKNSLFNRYKYSKSDTNIAISKIAAQQIKSIAPNSNINIIHDGVEQVAPIFTRDEVHKKFNIPTNKFIIGTVGYFTSEKNSELLFELADKLADNNNNSIIVILGKFKDCYIKDAEKRDNVFTPGIVENAINYYSIFDMYISTSKKEGLGSALLDAIIQKIPVVAFNSGGSEDIFPDNHPSHIENRSSSDFINRVIDTIDNYDKAKTVAVSLKNSVTDNFSIDQLIGKHLDIYND